MDTVTAADFFYAKLILVGLCQQMEFQIDI